MSGHLNGIVRRLDDLTTEEMLVLHREVCRRAAVIYEPRYREKREANYRASMPRAAAASNRLRS